MQIGLPAIQEVLKKLVVFKPSSSKQDENNTQVAQILSLLKRITIALWIPITKEINKIANDTKKSTDLNGIKDFFQKALKDKDLQKNMWANCSSQDIWLVRRSLKAIIDMVSATSIINDNRQFFEAMVRDAIGKERFENESKRIFDGKKINTTKKIWTIDQSTKSTTCKEIKLSDKELEEGTKKLKQDAKDEVTGSMLNQARTVCEVLRDIAGEMELVKQQEEKIHNELQDLLSKISLDGKKQTVLEGCLTNNTTLIKSTIQELKLISEEQLKLKSRESLSGTNLIFWNGNGKEFSQYEEQFKQQVKESICLDKEVVAKYTEFMQELNKLLDDVCSGKNILPVSNEKHEREKYIEIYVDKIGEMLLNQKRKVLPQFIGQWNKCDKTSAIKKYLVFDQALNNAANQVPQVISERMIIKGKYNNETTRVDQYRKKTEQNLNDHLIQSLKKTKINELKSGYSECSIFMKAITTRAQTLISPLVIEVQKEMSKNYDEFKKLDIATMTTSKYGEQVSQLKFKYEATINKMIKVFAKAFDAIVQEEKNNFDLREKNKSVEIEKMLKAVHDEASNTLKILNLKENSLNEQLKQMMNTCDKYRKNMTQQPAWMMAKNIEECRKKIAEEISNFAELIKIQRKQEELEIKKIIENVVKVNMSFIVTQAQQQLKSIGLVEYRENSFFERKIEPVIKNWQVVITNEVIIKRNQSNNDTLETPQIINNIFNANKEKITKELSSVIATQKEKENIDRYNRCSMGGSHM